MQHARKDWTFNMQSSYSSDGPRQGRRARDQAPEPKEFDERVVAVDRVARVVKGGRRFRFRALVVVGDNKSKVGAGVAKGADVTAAVSKAAEIAKKNFVYIAVTKNEAKTIPHEVEGRVGGARILIKPATSGTGLIAGSVVRTILEVGGVQNALSKSLGSSNKINMAYATLEALGISLPKDKWLNSSNKSQETRVKNNDKAAKKEATKTKTPNAAKAKEGNK